MMLCGNVVHGDRMSIQVSLIMYVTLLNVIPNNDWSGLAAELRQKSAVNGSKVSMV